MEILRIENLNFAYPNSDKKALDDISFSVNEGDFIVVCGRSGCGKTTLLKAIKREMTPHGAMDGRIVYNGVSLDKLDARTAAKDIGYVVQKPEGQIITDKVWHELAFGLESLGLSTPVIRRRVGEMANYFGIHHWFREDTKTLSGGQKQILNLASVMAMQPQILLLDEPTSQLDPIAASEFISTLYKLNRELGLTIIIVEHRLEEVFPIADKVMVMDESRISVFAPPRSVWRNLTCINKDHPMIEALPSAVRIYSKLDGHGADEECPLTVKEGRQVINNNYDERTTEKPKQPAEKRNEVVLLKNVWFRYERDLPDILRGVSLKLFEGEIYCLLGGNGTGKTTTLNVASGLMKAYRGKVEIRGKAIQKYSKKELYRSNVALLPQDTQTVFLKSTVSEDYEEITKTLCYDKQKTKRVIDEISQKLNIGHLMAKHPYDLSGGEQQKCALGKMLLLQPKILMLDEPTKGLDPFTKNALISTLKELKGQGLTLFLVTHDVEFACKIADRCALFFDGEVISEDIPSLFFAENNFYTTAANRMARRRFPYSVTVEDVIEQCMSHKKEKAGI